MKKTIWYKTKNKDQIEKLYRSLIPKLQRTAKAYGYNLLVHGSLRRDLDLVAIPWVEKAITSEKLAKLLHIAILGKDNPYLLSAYKTPQGKPHGRLGIVLAIGEHKPHGKVNAHLYLDLSIMPLELPQ